MLDLEQAAIVELNPSSIICFVHFPCKLVAVFPPFLESCNSEIDDPCRQNIALGLWVEQAPINL